MGDFMQDIYLCHHGVKGQRWGVRKKRQARKRRNSGTNRTMSKRQKYIQ